MDELVMIEHFLEGGEFVGFYALKKCELRETDGMFRLEIELSDRTGHIPAVAWNDAKELRESLRKGQVVKVKGIVGTYREKLQARIEKIRPAQDGEYDPQSILPSTPYNVDEMATRVDRLVTSITDPHLKKLVDMIFSNAQFIKEFKHSPGGSKWHHNYLGGLLEHSLGVTELCDFIAGKHPHLNRDLLITAGLLHDVGKIKEFSVSAVIEYSDEGRLEGHIVMGERFVRNMCDRISNFPGKLKMLLSHLMLSHQGFKAFSSPVEPMIPEGFVLYYTDELDSKLNALKRISQKARDEGKSWSEYVNVLQRYIYTGDREGDLLR
ncbi:3'-5' exoribonuclease YhaM family protein [Candidatus Omnitrophota bacterium]